MPLWHVHHPADTYSDADKQDFARDITALYASFGLPEFYVVVLFQEIEETSFFVGGKPSNNTVRIVVEHLARHLDDPQMRKRSTQRLNSIMEPYTGARGLHWEFHTYESPRDLWMIDGLFPPDAGSEAEKAWARANEPIPYS
ncbi:4-oxalocrotonate tautomerase [Nocardia sp. 852002-20019_SCH5090214]|jgi:phenylpyruvate tautomerase PptA (4-oxalocrotonate tautomerase family)|uniref:4-oxalocrotonate tautomerase n=1 Tax=Nocardia nova TaxID=37330 RepID=A0A2S5ZZQ0_9NOCA|nr:MULTISPECIES: tautomerase family protein [Nocardia]OBF86582.1 4-oxalocrotonate tautomerase [Mycobacterium sp. 852002-51759_SCH5129042]MBF6275477.1 tautomerase family protein [Nocardia nova]MBV7704818.1 tautomerase family protein [Nocardia nova]OBA55509.1 4-oxalocrotonate tautomerase [Nocardia sp. 852002-20019_SCH5090214]OBA56353.1 4-oxalocrotonate tautomerase [Nocardia sp. 852002-51101_SCH5132738]